MRCTATCWRCAEALRRCPRRPATWLMAPCYRLTRSRSGSSAASRTRIGCWWSISVGNWTAARWPIRWWRRPKDADGCWSGRVKRRITTGAALGISGQPPVGASRARSRWSSRRAQTETRRPAWENDEHEILNLLAGAPAGVAGPRGIGRRRVGQPRVAGHQRSRRLCVGHRSWPTS